jgi:hypothetical protein
MLEFPDKPPKNLSKEQQKAFEAMRDLLRDLPEADRRYDGFTQSKSGLVISTDIARPRKFFSVKVFQADEEAGVVCFC